MKNRTHSFSFYHLGFLLASLVLFTWGCGAEKKAPSERVIEKTGTIEEGDFTDPNHGNLKYDAYTFEARTMNKVRIEVSSKDFSPLLKLMETATGAPLAEWDALYPTGEALCYTLAVDGEYEARVYAQSTGRGVYMLKIRISE